MKRIAPIALMLIACGGNVEIPGSDGVAGSVSSGGDGGGSSSSVGAGGSGGAGSDGGGGTADYNSTVVLSGLEKPRLLRCDSRWLYWNNYDSGDVVQARVESPEVRTDFWGVAPRAASSEVRGTDVLYVLLAAEQIVSLPKDWNPAHVLAEVPGIRGLAVNGEDIYWHTQRDIIGPSGKVFAADETIRDLAVDDDGIYFATSGAVYSVPLRGGTSTRLAEASSVQVIATDSGHVLFSTTEAVMMVAKNGGLPEKIGATTATTIAVSDDTYAWINGSEVYVKRGGEKARLVAPTNGSGGIALCNGHVFWASTNDGSIVRAAP
jgi:hypothetical protein